MNVKESLNASIAAFETDVSEKLDELFARVPQKAFSFIESGVITKEQLKVQSNREDPLIMEAVQLNVNSMCSYWMDGTAH